MYLAIREMVAIKQESDEVVVVLGSALNLQNVSVFAQADSAIGLLPLLPQTCARQPAVFTGVSSASGESQLDPLAPLACGSAESAGGVAQSGESAIEEGQRAAPFGESHGWRGREHITHSQSVPTPCELAARLTALPCALLFRTEHFPKLIPLISLVIFHYCLLIILGR